MRVNGVENERSVRRERLAPNVLVEMKGKVVEIERWFFCLGSCNIS